MALSSSPPRVSESSAVSAWRPVCLLHLCVLSSHCVPGWSGCSADVCSAVKKVAGERVALRGVLVSEGGKRKDF